MGNIKVFNLYNYKGFNNKFINILNKIGFSILNFAYVKNKNN